MLQHNYPGIPAHKKEHAEFIDFELACVEFYSPFLPMLDFLKEWLTKHISDTDIKIGRYLKKAMKDTE